MTEPSSAKLAAALRAVGLESIAVDAEADKYHDYKSDIPFPAITLVHRLHAAALTYPGMAPAILSLRERVKQGEFDATAEEAQEWAESPEGEETFRKLTEERRRG